MLCNYKIKVIPKEKIYYVNINYNKEDGDRFNHLIEQITKDLKKFGDRRYDFLSFMMNYTNVINRLNIVFNMLSDEISKKTYFDAVKHRLTYWLSRVEPSMTPSYTLQTPKYPVPKLKGEKTEVKKCITSLYVHCQYEIPGIVEINKGDIVIDAGACYGDSALYFDSAVYPDGKVYAFEPNKDISKILQENILSNKGKNIVIVEKGLSDKISFTKISNNGTASTIIDSITDENSDSLLEIETTTIDDFVEQNQIKKINFIKMDIEGYEYNALNGAKNVIKNHKPKLAISIYHQCSDLYELPLLIHEINSDYKFYIRHASINWNETILFCI
ncbi:MAG: FkbM family methyltransferase [Clostridiales Family XIII bacterium]|nr:FkbM family methyltransferase [Clostridiales Family XIII bacterium]